MVYSPYFRDSLWEDHLFLEPWILVPSQTSLSVPLSLILANLSGVGNSELGKTDRLPDRNHRPITAWSLTG